MINICSGVEGQYGCWQALNRVMMMESLNGGECFSQLRLTAWKAGECGVMVPHTH